MSVRRTLRGGAILCTLLLGFSHGAQGTPPSAGPSAGVQTLLAEIARVHGLDAAQQARLAAIFAASPRMGQGNPAVTRHPMDIEQCKAREAAAGVTFDRKDFAQICGGPNMAPLFNPATEGPTEARSCIDQLEYPDIPCEYPVVWARASEAVEVCAAMGKRICDAHEWEGACAGALLPPDYRFELAKGQSDLSAVNRMRGPHNREASATRAWSYGPAYQKGVCAAASSKTPGCTGGDWAGCGSNTYPTGAFPECHSALGVYDLNGNAAEHMNLPLAPEQMASAGATSLGVTEMKGSWFIFDSYRAHDDWCRWRAPFWHGTDIEDAASHQNYHLGFRCCKSLEAPPDGAAGSL